MNQFFKVSFFILLYFLNLQCHANKNDLKLELLQVIFRHGDRIPQKDESYEKDPYYPHQYELLGYGQLTEVGIFRSYKFGQVLRKRYADFLGNYRYNKVHGYSTDRDRTKVSLQALLAGLYPLSTESWSKNDTIKLSPIPTNYDKTENNFLTRNVWGFCSKYQELKDKNEKSPEIQKKIQKYEKLLKYLEAVTGRDMSTLNGPAALYNNMKAVMSMNLPRPEWCSDTILEQLLNLTTIGYDSRSLTEPLRRIIVGPIIEQFLKNIENNNAKSDEGKKIYLYSAHDVLIGAITRVHNFTNVPGVPDYSSAVLIEKLRGKNNKTFIKMFFWTGVTEKMIPLTFQGIGYEIPLDEYKIRTKSILPRANDCL